MAGIDSFKHRSTFLVLTLRAYMRALIEMRRNYLQFLRADNSNGKPGLGVIPLDNNPAASLQSAIILS